MFGKEVHSRIYFIALACLAASLPLSIYTTSMFQLILLGNWIFEGRFAEKWVMFRERKSIWLILSVYLVFLIGLIYTSDFDYALHDLVGKALVDINWDTRPYPAGAYQIVVELLDGAGRVLDTAAEEVRLGTYGAKLDLFTASQAYFVVGDQIQLNMGVVNTGTLPISGTAVFLVQEAEGLAVTSMLTVPVEGLAPGVATKVSVVWDSAGAAAHSYRVLGYFKYRSRTTEPEALILDRPRVLLPLVQRNE